ncbi:hypothetical protein Patl1_24215 [Pistacia atlantica]|uniref:Uncharacterized protein n=1 Tax=Pistacia atlantica TaxID=434234 RepID=A0ACC1A2J3_9ROSI|nr:hypothetical protein Patl1_24215 [Pistacia atlantica]
MSAICRNLVANNFTLESSSSSSNKCILLFPSLFCLQRNFPCNQGSPVYSTASASSLRYYGLGLENGNYTLTLQFAEIADLDTTGRRSLGNGEGIHVEKDFDITRVADRIPRTAVQRIYTAQVSENYMEIHFFGAGKGTCCMPNDDSYGPLISAISAAPDIDLTIELDTDFEPTVRPPGG